MKRLVTGRLSFGRDLDDGSRLSPSEQARGHYLQPGRFRHSVLALGRTPERCGWCGEPLPQELTARHGRLHLHHDDLGHHFHHRCWTARLLGIAVVFGQIPRDALARDLGVRPGGSRHPRGRVSHSVTVIVKRICRIR